jgi:hypothetical protein
MCRLTSGTRPSSIDSMAAEENFYSCLLTHTHANTHTYIYTYIHVQADIGDKTVFELMAAKEAAEKA